MRTFFKDERKALAAILVAAFLVRLGCALTILVIAHDGARFTGMARYFADGRWDEGLAVWPPMPPLYSILLLAFGGTPVLSAVTGTLAIVPLYAMARSVWDRRIATLSALLASFLPDAIDYGGLVMSEGTFCLFFFAAMEFVRRGAEHGRTRDWILAGLSGGFAALTRAEGIYVAAAIAGWAAIRAIRLGGWGRRATGAALALIVFGAVVFPYAQWIHSKTGRWAISDSPFSQDLLYHLKLSKTPSTAHNPLEGIDVGTLEEQRMSDEYGRFGGLALHYVGQVFRLCGGVFFPFLLIGFFQLRRIAGDWFILLVGLAYSIPPFLMLATGLPFSHRYLLPGIFFWIPIMAVGLVAAGGWLARSVPEPKRLALASLFLALCFGGFIVKAGRPSDAHRRTLVDAGHWIKSNAGPRPVLIAMDRRVEHYAEGYSSIAPATFEALKGMVEKNKAQWVVLLPRRIPRFEPGYLAKVEAAFPLAHVIDASKRGEEVRIYRTRR